MDFDSIAARAASYLAVPAVVGFEGPLFTRIASDLEATGLPQHRRKGLLAVGQGEPVVSAHIDRHGFVTADGGRIDYAASITSKTTISATLATSVCQRYHAEQVTAYHRQTGEVIAEGFVGHDSVCAVTQPLDLTVDAFAKLAAGIPVALSTVATRDGPWLTGQLDNALSVALLVEALFDGFEGTVLFSAAEEAGLSWSAIADWFDQPTDNLIVMDTSPFDDARAATNGVVVLRQADAGAAFSSATSQSLCDHARRLGIPTVWKDQVLSALGRPLGRTELGRVIAGTNGRVTGTTLQIPTTNYHTTHETTSLAAVEAAYALLTSWRG